MSSRRILETGSSLKPLIDLRSLITFSSFIDRPQHQKLASLPQRVKGQKTCRLKLMLMQWPPALAAFSEMHSQKPTHISAKTFDWDVSDALHPHKTTVLSFISQCRSLIRLAGSLCRGRRFLCGSSKENV